MSKTPRTPRAKSGGLRPLGSIRLQQNTTQVSVPTRNDPALHINQIHTNTVAPSALDKTKDIAKEREYQALRNLYVTQRLDKDLLGKRLNMLKEKERKLKDQIAALEKLIAQLQKELKQKSEKCQSLQQTVTNQTKEYEESLAKCNEEHDKTKTELEVSRNAEAESRKLLQTTVADYESKIKDIIDEYEKKLQDLRESKERELQEKDEKMNLLKQRMAATLGKNSQERQQQLEELKKDLVKQAQEARELQQKLKHFQIKSQSCDNCAKLEHKLEEKTLQLRLKEKTVNELQGIGRKMQLQLHQQDIILQKWEERENQEGYK